LSIVAGWYDPMGLISPITIKYKIELSEIVKRKDLSWDDALGEELTDHFGGAAHGDREHAGAQIL
jgi:hypothetical protein